jgi:hypothetical protein
MQHFLRQNKQAFLSIIGLVALLGLAFWVTGHRADQNFSTANSAETRSEQISYQGQQGRTALDILKQTHSVDTQEFAGFGEFVTGINGVSAGTTHFWAFYVNGKMADVGADAYITKDSDVVEWKLEKIN